MGKKSAAIIKSGRGSTTSHFKQILFHNFPSTSNPHTRQELLRQSKNLLFLVNVVFSGTRDQEQSLSLCGVESWCYCSMPTASQIERTQQTLSEILCEAAGGCTRDSLTRTASYSDPQGESIHSFKSLFSQFCAVQRNRKSPFKNPRGIFFSDIGQHLIKRNVLSVQRYKRDKSNVGFFFWELK